MTAKRFFMVAIYAMISACGVAPQPESAKTVAAFEIPLTSEAERVEFFSVLRAAAEPVGMHLDIESAQQLEDAAKVSPAFKMTMNAAVWLGANDEEPIASVMDQPDHLGLVWLAFFKGKDPAIASRFRESAMKEVMARWPDVLSLPIMPTGAIPLRSDLIKTPVGYIVDPSKADKYRLERAKDPPH